MAEPTAGNNGTTFQIDISQIARAAMKSNPRTESEARAAVQRAIQRLYPDLEQAALVFSAVWRAIEVEARAEGCDVLAVLTSAATDTTPRVLTIQTGPSVVRETMTVVPEGFPLDDLERPSPVTFRGGRLVFAIPTGWIYVVLAFILGICFAILAYAAVAHFVLGK